MNTIHTDSNTLIKDLDLVKAYRGNYWLPHTSGAIILEEFLISKEQLKNHKSLYNPDSTPNSISFALDRIFITSIKVFASIEHAADYYVSASIFRLTSEIDQLNKSISPNFFLKHLFTQDKKDKLLKLQEILNSINLSMITPKIKINKLKETFCTLPYVKVGEQVFTLENNNNIIKVINDETLSVQIFSCYGDLDFVFEYDTKVSNFKINKDCNPHIISSSKELFTNYAKHRIFFHRGDAVSAKK